MKGDIHQGPAVIGLAMVAMSEELGLDMEIRSLERVLQYGEQNIRRAVPLALGLLCISNPKVSIIFAYLVFGGVQLLFCLRILLLLSNFFIIPGDCYGHFEQTKP